MARATIMVRLENTDDKQALLVKELITKAVEKIPGAEIELHVMGK